MAGNKLAVLNLITELQAPEVDIMGLTQVITRDPTLSFKLLKIINSAASDGLGRTPGYRLMPTSCITALGGERSQLGLRGGFSRYHLWVTPTTEAERWPAGDYVNQSQPGEGLPNWVQADRSVANCPITVWHVFGLHHQPRTEDFPVQPAVSSSMILTPDGFFARNPTLDVPPSSSSHSCHV